MGNVYVIKDSKIKGGCSKGNNFNSEWMKFYKFAKFAPDKYEFLPGDTAVAYLDNSSPFSLHNIPKETKKVLFVGSLEKATAPYLATADHVIFMNPIQKMISDKFKLSDVPHTVLPSFPLHIWNSEVIKEDRLYIGGWADSSRMEGLVDKMVRISETMPSNVIFDLALVGTEIPDIKERMGTMKSILEASKLNRSRIVRLMFDEKFFEHMLFNIRVCKYMYAWNSGPSQSEVISKIISGDRSVLDIPIRESAMLAHGIGAGCDMIVDDSISHISHFKETPRITFSDLAKKLENIFVI